MVECSASAMSTVASPNFRVSPPFATTIGFSGAPSFFGGFSRDWGTDDGCAGLRGNGANVRNMIEMRMRDEDRFGFRNVGSSEAKLMPPAACGQNQASEQIDLAPVSEFEIGVGEPTNDNRIGLRRGQWTACHGGLVTVAKPPEYRLQERSAGKG